jgi:hypothetical protein
MACIQILDLASIGLTCLLPVLAGAAMGTPIVVVRGS